MLDGGMDQADGAALAQAGAGSIVAIPAGSDRVTGWRDDLRLFGYAWAAGFVFFMVMLA